MRGRGAQTVAEGAEWDRIWSTCRRNDFWWWKEYFVVIGGKKEWMVAVPRKVYEFGSD